MKRRRVFMTAAVLVPAVAVLALLAYGFTREPRYIESPMLGRPAPAFELALFDGGRFRLEAARGKVARRQDRRSAARNSEREPGARGLSVHAVTMEETA